MCGFAACVALQHDGQAINGHVNNGYAVSSNGHASDDENAFCEIPGAMQNGWSKSGDALSNVIRDQEAHGTTTERSLRTQLQASIAMINHRGPDESSVWMSGDQSVALGHCRLSINDLSPSGSQPLHSDDGDIHAVVNGEIYEFDRLRRICRDVHGYRFASESDSELVLALYKIYGSPGFFDYLRGEFSFVVYDERPGKKRVIACRDVRLASAPQKFSQRIC